MVLIATIIGAIVMTTAGEPVTAWQGAQSSTAAQTRLATPPPPPPPAPPPPHPSTQSPEHKVTGDQMKKWEKELSNWGRYMSIIDPVTGKPRDARDNVAFGTHDGTSGHMDALCHYAVQGNGPDVPPVVY